MRQDFHRSTGHLQKYNRQLFRLYLAFATCNESLSDFGGLDFEHGNMSRKWKRFARRPYVREPSPTALHLGEDMSPSPCLKKDLKNQPQW